MQKKSFVMSLIVGTLTAFILFYSFTFLFADDAEKHSATAGLNSASIGAYYDELWEATRIFRIQRSSASPNQVIYAVQNSSTSNFATSSDPTVSVNGATSAATLPQHTVVTEWEVSGHVHFPN